MHTTLITSTQYIIESDIFRQSRDCVGVYVYFQLTEVAETALRGVRASCCCDFGGGGSRFWEPEGKRSGFSLLLLLLLE